MAPRASEHEGSAAGGGRPGEATERWLERVLVGEPSSLGAPGASGWLDTAFPVSFVYGGQLSAGQIGAWSRAVETRHDPDGRAVRVLRLSDPVTGLEVIWEAVTWPDSPAVEWIARLRNGGSTPTPVIEQLHALDLLAATDCYDLQVYYATGGHATPDAFAPQVHCLRSEPPGPFRLGSLGGRSSNGTLPYFNVEATWGTYRGLVVAVGWSGSSPDSRDAAAWVADQAGGSARSRL